MANETWVLDDTTPKDYTITGGDDLTTATGVTAAMSKDGTTVAVTAAVSDASTVSLTRSGLSLSVGTWRLEIEATYPSGTQTYPEDTPHVVHVRDDIA